MKEKYNIITDIIDNLRRVFQILNERSKKVEKATGLTGPQLWAIKVIYESAPINLSDLSHRLYLHPTTVGGIIDRLEGRGFVKRTRSKQDRRMVWIELTPEGRSLAGSAPEVVQGWLVKGLENMNLEELKDIDRSMGKIVEVFGAQKIPPQLIRSIEVNYPKDKAGSGHEEL